MRNTKLQACCHTGIIQTTSLPSHRRNTKQQACRHTGIIQTTSSPPHRRNTKQQALSLQPYRQQNFLLSFFSFSPPHRRSTKLQAYSHAGNKTTSLPPHRRDSKTTNVLQHRQNKLQTRRLAGLISYK